MQVTSPRKQTSFKPLCYSQLQAVPLTLADLFKRSSLLEEFFQQQRAQTIEQLLKVTVELLQAGVQSYKKTHPSPKHYNVAYVKHKRFLSPSQKVEVTPKVTEMIPVSPQKHIIYGKPKVELAEGYACTLHEEECPIENQVFMQNQYENEEESCESSSQLANITNKVEKEPEGSRKQLPKHYETVHIPKKQQSVRQLKHGLKASSSPDYTATQIKSPQAKRSSGVSRMASPKNQSCQNRCTENYKHVQSRIKELVQRDKKNKELEEELEKQKRQIEMIEERQNRLLQIQQHQKQYLTSCSPNRSKDERMYRYEVHKTRKIHKQSSSSVSSSDSVTSEEGDTVVNLHGHQHDESRIECYDCEIQRLRKRKEKAHRALKVFSQKELRKQHFPNMIANSSEISSSSECGHQSKVYRQNRDLCDSNHASRLSYEERSRLLRQ